MFSVADPTKSITATDVFVFIFFVEGFLQELVELMRNGIRFHVRAYRNAFDGIEAICGLAVSLLRVSLTTEGPWSAGTQT
jgi:hypothetical protein